jgi:hypothetical protein
MAIALGLPAIRQCSWVEEIGQKFSIRILARDTSVEHIVEFRAFHKWLEDRGRTPREITARARVRELSGAAFKERHRSVERHCHHHAQGTY